MRPALNPAALNSGVPMSTNSAPPYPKVVMIIRHGEKPGAQDKDDNTSGPDLSIRGSARAAALPSLFTPDPSGSGTSMQQLSCAVAVRKNSQFDGTYQRPAGTVAAAPRFPTPQHIVATKTSNNSNRPIETVTPVAQALGHKIHANYDDKDTEIAAQANDVLTKYHGDVVLVCWHHGNIPQLARSLGVPQTQIDTALGGAGQKWQASVFDRIWMIDWDKGSANLTVRFQQLLFGDHKQVTKIPIDGKC
jgi:hypothetical protein